MKHSEEAALGFAWQSLRKAAMAKDMRACLYWLSKIVIHTQSTERPYAVIEW